MSEALNNHIANMTALGMNAGPERQVFYLDPGDRSEVTSHTDGDFRMICAICSQQLNAFSDTASGEGSVWVHARSWEKHDHDPEPKSVPATEVTTEICDFCSTPGTTYWVFVGEHMRSGGGGKVHDYGSKWGACQFCGDFIRANDLEGMLERVMRVSPLREVRGEDPHVNAAVRRELLNMWMLFLPTVTDQIYVGPKRVPARIHPRMMPKLQQGLVKYWTYPELVDVMAASQLHREQVLALPGVHAGQPERFMVPFPPGRPVPEQVFANHAQHIAAGVESCELYWISSKFTQLAMMAGKDFEKLSLTREELPSPFGFMMFEQPIGEIPRAGGAADIRGVSWTLVPDGIWLNLYIQGEDADPDADVESMREKFGWLLCPNFGSGIAFGMDIPIPKDTEKPEAIITTMTTIFATWFLMTQPGVADTNKAPVDKKLARSYQRTHHRAMPDVQLVDLRRAPVRSTTTPTDRESRTYNWRVFRKGHWKNQPYGPKRGLRKQIYISPYIAGPEGAPLYQKPPTVKVLR